MSKNSQADSETAGGGGATETPHLAVAIAAGVGTGALVGALIAWTTHSYAAETTDQARQMLDRLTRAIDRSRRY